MSRPTPNQLLPVVLGMGGAKRPASISHRNVALVARCAPYKMFASARGTTFIGAQVLSRITAPMVLDRPMTGTWFLACVEQVLVRTLSPGDVVILDNLPAHKGSAAREEVSGSSLRAAEPVLVVEFSSGTRVTIGSQAPAALVGAALKALR